MAVDKTTKFRRWVTGSAAVIVVGALVWFFTLYGNWKVIPGMDTMIPEYPPGATCIIKKNPGQVQAKTSVVIIQVSAKALLLSRVDRIDGDKIYIKHDNRGSVFLHYEKKSYTIADVRGLVMTVLVPDPEIPNAKKTNDGK
jgi:hypothetical protein